MYRWWSILKSLPLRLLQLHKLCLREGFFGAAPLEARVLSFLESGIVTFFVDELISPIFYISPSSPCDPSQ